MLTGQALGKAVDEAIRLKGVPKTTVARHFGIQGPSIYDWIKHGRVGKQHLDDLVEYFSDVVGPEHWGLSPGSSLSQFARLDAEIIRAAIILAKEAFRLGLNEELVIERDPEAFSQALRAAIAAKQRMEAANGNEPGSGDGEAGAAGGAQGSQEDGSKARPETGRKRKQA